MAIDIRSLQEYVKLYPDLLVKTVYQDTVLNRFPVEVYERQTPGFYRARIFEPAAHLTSCCTIPDGESSIIEVDMEAVCLLDGAEYCETDLAQILRNEDFRFTAGQENAGSIEEAITRGQLSAFTEALDVLTFQGDKTSANENLNKVDGLLKQANTSTETRKVSISEGNVVTALQQIALQIPINAYKMGQIAIFIGEEYANAYQLALINMNLFHFMPANMDQATEQFILPGFANIVIIPTRGLNGTNQVLVTPLNNILWLTNNREDHNNLDWDYDKYHQRYYWRIKTIFGIKLLIDEWTIVGTVDPSIISNLGGMAVTIANEPLKVSNI